MRHRELIWAFAFLIPALVLFCLFVFYPLLRSAVFAFTNWRSDGLPWKFIGFSNFIRMFSDSSVKAGIFNTLKFALFTTVISNLFNLLLALVLDSSLRVRTFLRTAFFIPSLVSATIVAASFKSILQYNGVLNELLRAIGLGSLTTDFFTNASAAMPVYMGLNVWQYIGYGAVIYLAGLQNISPEYYEAAKLDGANRLQSFSRITLPLLMPSITIMTFVCLVGGLKFFDLAFILPLGGTAQASQTVSAAIYQTAYKNGLPGYAMAISLVFFLVIAVITFFQLRFTRKREVEM